MSLFERISGDFVARAIGGQRSALTSMVGGAIGTIGTGILKSKLPRGAGPVVDAVLNTADMALAGDWKGVLTKAVNSGIFTAKLPWLDNAGSLAWFMSQPNRSMAGLLPMHAKQLMQESLETNFARKNLFMVDVKTDSSSCVNHPALNAAFMGKYARFNMFVTDISYGPWTIEGDSHKVGASVMDARNGASPIDLRITTMDDERGTVKSWFDSLCNKVARSDGTFGVPAEYLIQINVLHSFITEEVRTGYVGSRSGFRADAWYRPASMELDLSRKDDGIEEITLVFRQYDTSFPT